MNEDSNRVSRFQRWDDHQIIKHLALAKTLERGSQGYYLSLQLVYTLMKKEQLNQLKQLIENNPVLDEELMSKDIRDQLVQWGLVERIESNDTGINIPTYLAYSMINQGIQ